MTTLPRRTKSRRTLAATLGLALTAGQAFAADTCPALQASPLLPSDTDACHALLPKMQSPGSVPLAEYEATLDKFLGNFCHRDTAAGWVPDKDVRDTGPFTVSLTDGSGDGEYHGTHAPVVIWYSPEAAQWIRENRSSEAPTEPATPMPAGAILVKEMFPAPAALCAGSDLTHLLPTSGAAVMVRAPEASRDGWFWGWYGWAGWTPDYPADPATNRLPYMGFGQYCTNCHASALDNFTFASPVNMEGEPGTPLAFLSQHRLGASTPAQPHHLNVVLPDADGLRLGEPHYSASAAFIEAYLAGQDMPDRADVPPMPSQTYDTVWAPADAPSDHGMFLTSDQCLGCHDAGSTGLQFDMAIPATGDHAGLLQNNSPYGTWATSPMGLAGRDPIFFAQLASETQSFHAESAAMVEDTCLGCHGIMGQRQFGIDNVAAGDSCGAFGRDMVNATPVSGGIASFGALARDGISCLACHRMELGAEADALNEAASRNACVVERRDLLNPDEDGFARSFTGSFFVAEPKKVFGPFKDVKTAPMEAALGVIPQHSDTIGSSEMCGTCHTVHLPVMEEGKILTRTYEQLTYPEWAFSGYRTGWTVDGDLPFGPGDREQSCQDCHMPSTEADGTPTVSKIASIQEFSNFSAAEFTRAPDKIDLPEREGFARHVLVGLNVFFIKMAQQFPDLLGIRTQDPMLVAKGVDSLIATEQAMLDQAQDHTAQVTLTTPQLSNDTLSTTVTVTNLAGHKLPSGVGFRRAFLSFEVLDTRGRVLWASGATDRLGRIVDGAGAPIAGEEWWTPDCATRIAPEQRVHQPHYQKVTAQSQAQIYQELVSTPAPGAICGHDAEPAGQLTTSFLSICAEVKDNRLPPFGYLPEAKRVEISHALGAGTDMAQDAGFTAVGNDPDYAIPEDGTSAGSDSVSFAVPLAGLASRPASVRARLWYQAIPPYYLQDRFCTAKGVDRDRLALMAGHLNLDGTAAESWKLQLGETANALLPATP
ncbi:hypothetical protein [Primorskyibacter flagellatus]|uniref:Cytochrome P460 domain-containing protein n=1 Tax=Primorskyibacter flagellatus TaxID=1387277 RepID=A0A1W2BYX9_9RHOB|nr:hypothetical protein [Primorskyibacter flagellatus]SMC77698.1 hypothetical protein SAMN06295998_10584 [Primorskyibacter flagellatus]